MPDILQVNGYGKVYWIKKSLISSEPSMLCEMVTLGCGGDEMSEEQAIGLDNITPEDFETLVHFYNDFRSGASACRH